MSRRDLSLFSYEILGLVGRAGAGPHDLLQMARRGPMLAWAGESQYYVEPKRLAKLGYLKARREPGRTGERTVYRLTDAGLEALRREAAQPAHFTPLKSEPLLRLLIADLVGPKATREGLAPLRDEIAKLHEYVDAAEANAAELPHRERYLRLVTGFLRRYLALHIELLDELEQELAADERATR
jgi:DNA-binding PadR family transcriptional regulator